MWGRKIRPRRLSAIFLPGIFLLPPIFERIRVIFDEFQELLLLGGAGIEKQLRAAIQTHERVSYVFAGSETSLLTDMISNSARPFYRLGEPLFLKTIP
jgi:hypothetical protein